jgi:uncharacterized membrane protein (UPF0127 family)
MGVNKIIVVIGIMFAIFIAFIFIQYNPFGTSAAPENTSTVTIKNQTFSVSVAETEVDKQKGLSGKASLPLTEGKLFLFDTPDTYTFWMKDMKFPIDIIFINGDTIVSIAENARPVTSGTMPLYKPTGSSDKVLEINAGLSKKYNFKPGDKVTIQIKE